MKIVFAALGCEHLGISQLSAIAKSAGHDVALAFSPGLFDDRNHICIPMLARVFHDMDCVVGDIRRQDPEVIAFSPTSGSYRWAMDVASRAKAVCPEAKIVFGGIHTTAEPDRVIARPEVDYICIGEGDAVFLEILRHVREGGERPISNTWYKTPDGRIIRGRQDGFIQDLDALPFFDKILWEDQVLNHDFYITTSSRGCPYRCTYCFNSFYADLGRGQPGAYLRRRSPDHMMEELRVFKRRYRFKLVEFFDDIFSMHPDWLKKFLPLYRDEIGTPFQIFTHVKYVDEERAALLADAGCIAAQIGVQSLDDQYKREVIKRPETAEDAGRVIRLLTRHGIRPKIDHMLGLPDEPIEAQELARVFYTETPPYRIQTYWTNYFPGTQMLQEAVRSGRIGPEDAGRLREGYGMDTFTHGNALIDSGKRKTYQVYELIFKLIPNLPRALRQRLQPGLFMWMPSPAVGMLSFFVDMVTGLCKLDCDHIFYAKYYLYHIAVHLLRRCGLSGWKASRVYARDPVEFYFSKDLNKAQDPEVLFPEACMEDA